MPGAMLSESRPNTATDSDDGDKLLCISCCRKAGCAGLTVGNASSGVKSVPAYCCCACLADGAGGTSPFVSVAEDCGSFWCGEGSCAKACGISCGNWASVSIIKVFAVNVDDSCCTVMLSVSYMSTILIISRGF